MQSEDVLACANQCLGHRLFHRMPGRNLVVFLGLLAAERYMRFQSAQSTAGFATVGALAAELKVLLDRSTLGLEVAERALLEVFDARGSNVFLLLQALESIKRRGIHKASELFPCKLGIAVVAGETGGSASGKGHLRVHILLCAIPAEEVSALPIADHHPTGRLLVEAALTNKEVSGTGQQQHCGIPFQQSARELGLVVICFVLVVLMLIIDAFCCHYVNTDSQSRKRERTLIRGTFLLGRAKLLRHLTLSRRLRLMKHFRMEHHSARLIDFAKRRIRGIRVIPRLVVQGKAGIKKRLFFQKTIDVLDRNIQIHMTKCF